MPIFARWIVAAVAVLTLAMPVRAPAGPSRLEIVLAKGEVRVCVRPELLGLSYRNPHTNIMEGLDVDLARTLGDDLGVIVRFVYSSPATLLDDLSSGACDVAMFGIDRTPLHERQVDFTAPYLVGDLAGITSIANTFLQRWEDIDRRDVVVVAGAGTVAAATMRTLFRSATLTEVAPPLTGEEEVESGRADLFLAEQPFAHRFTTLHYWARVLPPPRPIHPTPYAYALLKGDTVWLEALNQTIAAVKRDGRLAAIAARYGLTTLVVSD